MEFVIREATRKDAKAIADLNRTAMEYDYPTAETEKKLQTVLNSGKDKVFVAVSGYTVIGYIHANDYELLYFPAMKNIMGIAVDSAYRKCGVGKALLSAVETWAKETGAAGLRLVSGAGRKEAHTFYRSCGFSGGREQINFKKVF